MLIHGEEDHAISPWHSEMIAKAAPDHVHLWLVPHAFHTGAWSAAHQEFETRVLGWFAEHQKARSIQQSALSKNFNRKAREERKEI